MEDWESGRDMTAATRTSRHNGTRQAVTTTVAVAAALLGAILDGPLGGRARKVVGVTTMITACQGAI